MIRKPLYFNVRLSEMISESERENGPVSVNTPLILTEIAFATSRSPTSYLFVVATLQ